MGSFLQQPIADVAQRVPPWMQSLQAAGLAHWQQSSWPTRRTEAWKYTSLKPLRDDYTFITPDQSTYQPEAPLKPLSGDCQLVFVDGVYRADLSSAVSQDGVAVCRFDEANAEQQEVIRQRLNSSLSQEQHMFAALNTATLHDGVLLEIDANYSGDAVVEVLSISGAHDSPVASNQRLLVVANPGSTATVVERFVSLDGGCASFSTGVTELFVGANACVKHYRLHEERDAAVHIGGVYTRLDRDARLQSFHLALGSELKRLDLLVHHDAPGAHAGINGVYLPRGRELIDYHTTIEHAVPHCTTDEVFRGIIGDSATAVFNGRIHIHQDAQKTLAELSNRNLLTSARAQINTKPELEIYADDVRCAHGATVAQLDKAALHYLRARGVEKHDAEMMLSFGFINELIDAIEIDAIGTHLRDLVATSYFKPSRQGDAG
ncbi:MAG: Fe-S cluster assembly protein SufD [Pseudomonadota bacterium]